LKVDAMAVQSLLKWALGKSHLNKICGKAG
jgi:hypothetical protein